MNPQTLNVPSPQYPTLGWGIAVLAVAILGLTILSLDDPPRLAFLGVTATSLAIGLLLGWHLNRLQRSAGPPEPPRLLVAETLGHQGVLLGLWALWLLALEPALDTAVLPLLAGAIGLVWPFLTRPVGLGSAVVVLALAFSNTARPWLGMLPVAAGLLGASLLALATVLTRVMRNAYPDQAQPLRLASTGMLFDRQEAPEPLADNLALALRVGARQSWMLAGIMLTITSLVTLVTVFRPETRPDLLAMIFPVWLVGLLSMPVLVHLNSLRSLDRLWLTGAFETRRTFAQAVVAANAKHAGRMTVAAMGLLVVFMLFDDRVAAGGMAIIFTIFGGSMIVLGLSVWTMQDYPRRLPTAVAVVVTIVLVLLASYGAIVNDLLFEDATTEPATAAAVTLVGRFVGLRWARYTLSQGPFAVGASSSRPRRQSGQ